MVYRIVMRDLKSRCKQTALGPFWIVVMPMISAGLMSLILGGVAGLDAKKGANGLEMPYFVFVLAGQLIWGAYTNACGASASGLRSQSGLLTKVYFPRLIAPITGIANGLLDFILLLVVLFIFMIAFGMTFPWQIVLMPVFVILAWMVGMSWGLWIASISVRFRDLGRITGFLNKILVWGTPIFWSSQYVLEDKAGTIPGRWQPLAEVAIQINPLFHVVEGFRWATLGADWHVSMYTVISLGLCALLFVGGLYQFRRVDANVADFI